MAFSAAHKHLFYTEIAKLLEAGFGIREAGKAMLDTRLPAGQAELLRRMEVDLEAGKSITEAFGPGVITPLERSIIGAGERGGRMAPASCTRSVTDWGTDPGFRPGGAVRPCRVGPDLHTCLDSGGAAEQVLGADERRVR